MEPSTVNGKTPANNCDVAKVATVAGKSNFVIKSTLIELKIIPVIIATSNSIGKLAPFLPIAASNRQMTEIKGPAEISMLDVKIIKFIPMEAINK